MNGGTFADRRGGQAAHIGQGLDGAGAQVEQGAGIDAGADLLPGLFRRQQPHRGAARLPLGFALFQFIQALGTDGAMQGAVLLQFAVDAVPGDDVEDGLGRIAQQGQQAVTVHGPQHIGQCVGHDPHAGIDQADITPGAAETDRAGFQHNGLDATLSQVQRRRQAGIAAADDRHIGAHLARQRRGLGRVGGRHRPKSVGGGFRQGELGLVYAISVCYRAVIAVHIAFLA